MNGKQLRASILQEAIAGRLVPQDPSDEPASELLHRINPKATPLETDEPLPQGWCACQLKDMVSIVTGDKDANHGKENGQYDFFTCALIPIKSDTYSFEGESLILPGNGANVGVVTHYNGRFEAYQRTYVLQAASADVYLRYLYWHMSANWRAYNEDKLYGSAIPYIKYGNLATYPVYLPPLAEQKRIVAKIEELMPLVDEYEKAQEEFDNLNAGLKNKLRASLLQEAIAGRLVPQDPNDEPASELLHRINPKATPLETEQPLPQGWVWCKPSDLGTFGMGKTILKKDLLTEGIPVYSATMGDEPFGWIKKEDNKLKLTKGDLVIPARGSLGYVKLIKDEEATSTQTTIYAKVIDREVSPFLYYYYHACRTTIFKSTGTSTPQVTIEMLFRHPIPLPPLAEQKRIVEKLESMFAVLDNLDALTA